MKKLLLMSLFSFWFIPTAIAQQQVSGKVTDETTQDPLPGANIQVEGASKGVMTDFDGGFTINVSQSATLVISYVGYESKKVVVGNQSTINIALKPSMEALEEVVITGYGRVKKTDLTSAQTTVDAQDIALTVNTTVGQALQGRAPGVYVTQNSGAPGGGISVNIRGVNSLNGTNQPLYVIDGVQIQPDRVSYGSFSSVDPLAGLNPSDIETMNILQGPSATALYGSRGTNGVVVITTKRGQAGVIKVSYEYNYSLQTAPEHIDIMNLRQYAQLNGEYHVQAGGKTPDEYLDPSILGKGTDWQKELFRNAPMTKHQIKLSGGSEKTTYFLSGELFDQEGIAKGSKFDRYSFRLNLDNQLKDWAKIGVNLSVNQTKNAVTTSSESIIQNSIRLSPNIPVRNFDGTYGGGSTDPASPERYSPPNPIAMANLNTNEITKRQFLGGLNLEINLTKDLTFRTNFSTNVEYSEAVIFFPKYKFGVNERIKTELTNDNQSNTYWNWSQQLNYVKEINRHNFGATLVHEAQSGTYKGLKGYRDTFSIDIIDLNVGDQSSSIASGGHGDWALESYLGSFNYNFSNKYFFQASLRADGSSNFGSENKWGYFPAFSAAWKINEESFFNVEAINQLKLRLETGKTGSNGPGGAIYGRLNGQPTQWGTGFLPAKYANNELAWEETTTQNIGINLGMFKNKISIDADYYVKKTDNLIMDLPLPLYYGTDGPGSMQSPTVNIGELQNKGWSFSLTTVNIDTKDFSWKTNFNISHFKTKIEKFYTESAILDRTSWWLDNWTQRSVVGQEPWLFYGYIEDGLFQSVEDINNSPVPVDNTGNRLPIQIDQGVWVGDVKFKDINGPDGVPDGIIDEKDQTFIGNPYPDFFGGLTNTLTYKGLTLNILLNGTFGNDVYNYTKRQSSNPNNINVGQNLLVEALNYARLTEDGDGNVIISNPETNLARLGNSRNGNYIRHSNKWVEDGSFLRIKNISLNYQVPISTIPSLKGLSSLNIGFGVQNVATFTKYSGYDPEIGEYTGSNVTPGSQPIGLDYGRYPLTPTYLVNVGINF